MSNPQSISQALPSISSASSASTATRSGKGTQASSRLYDISSLENDGSNFQTWKYRIKTILDIRGLWEIVSGAEAKPDGKDAAQLADWELRDKEARAQITLTLKDEPLSGVLHATMAAEIWKKLNERYEGQGKQTIAFLIGELFRGTLSDDSAMETQLNAMRQKAYIRKNTISFCNIKSTSCIINTSQSSHSYILPKDKCLFFCDTKSTSCVIKSNKYL